MRRLRCAALRGRLRAANIARVPVSGLAEMYMQEDDRERLKLLSRKGFVKTALESGADLVPIFHFGNTRVMDILGKGLMGISRKLRMSFLWPYGRFYLPLPRRVPIMSESRRPAAAAAVARCRRAADSRAAVNSGHRQAHRGQEDVAG